MIIGFLRNITKLVIVVFFLFALIGLFLYFMKLLVIFGVIFIFVYAIYKMITEKKKGE
jgi:chromate transport protein ChrA